MLRVVCRNRHQLRGRDAKLAGRVREEPVQSRDQIHKSQRNVMPTLVAMATADDCVPGGSEVGLHSLHQAQPPNLCR